MKLRRINALRYCDDETGTYFDLWEEVSLEEAAQMIVLDRQCYLAQYPAEGYFGTNRTVLRLGKRKRPRKRPPPTE